MRIFWSFLLMSSAPLLIQPPVGEWKPFTPKDGAFTVLLPGQPHEHKKTIKTGTGATDVTLFEMAVPPGDSKYAVGFADFPEASIKAGSEDKRLDNARDAAKNTAKGKLKREKSLLLDKYPGRELLIEIDDKKSVVLRIYAVKNRIYEVIAIGSAEFVTSPQTAKFMESFKLGK